MGIECLFGVLKGIGAVVGGVAGAGLGGVQIKKSLDKRRKELEEQEQTSAEEAEETKEDEG